MTLKFDVKWRDKVILGHFLQKIKVKWRQVIWRHMTCHLVPSLPGMAKGGSIPETPPLESKILENPYS